MADVRPVEVRTRLERFPASIKGAFVMRGADGNPHSVRMEWASLARIPSGQAKPVPVEERILDVAPARDLFVPFEVTLSDLEPSWYVIRSALRVDAGPSWQFQSRGFTVPWPSADVRRGTFAVRRTVDLDDRTFLIERVELGAETSVVCWHESRAEGAGGPGPDPGREVVGEAVLVADGEALDVLPASALEGRPELRGGTAEQRTISYPVGRSVRSLGVELRMPRGPRSEQVPVPIHGDT